MNITINKSFTFSEHDAPIYALEAFGDDAFFSGGGDRMVSCRQANETSEAKGIVNTGSTIYSLKYIPHKKILLAGVMGGGIHVIDLEQKKEIHYLLHHQKGVFDINYSVKHDIIISAGGDGKIIAWSGSDYSFLKEHTFCDSKIRSVSINKEESAAAIGCGDGSIRIISLDKFEEVHRIDAHNLSVNAVCYHPTMDVILSGGKDAYLKVWQAKENELIESVPAHNYAIYSICFSPAKNLFATASRDKTIKIWDPKNFNLLSRIDREKHHGHLHSVNKILWLKDVLISASDDRKIIGWKISK